MNQFTQLPPSLGLYGTGLSQHARLLTLTTAQDASQADALLVERFRGREAINELFCFDIDALSTSAHLDIDAFVGAELTLGLLQADGSRRAWHGLCTQSAWTGSDGGAARYRLRLEPALAQLKLRRDCFIFANASVRDVVIELLRDYPTIQFDFRISQPLAKQRSITQYRETDLAFLIRVLTSAGLNWRFEHEQDGPGSTAQARHRLIIFDSAAEAPPTPGGAVLRFHGVRSTERDDAIDGFTARRQLCANHVTSSGWNPEQLAAPRGKQDSRAEAGNLPPLPLYDGSGEQPYADNGAAGQHALRMLEALELEQKTWTGSGAVRRMAAGHSFRLSQHDSYAAGSDRFTTLWVEHEGRNNYTPALARQLSARTDSAIYRNRFGCVSDTAPIVPRATAERDAASVPGPQTALVIGPANAVAYTTRDHLVHLQFGWQRGPGANAGGRAHDTDSNGNAPSHRGPVRAAEALAGPNWGTRHTARNGSEVLTVFIEGDIDRPLTVAQLYNGADLPPYMAGAGTSINHAGLLSGLHSHNFAPGGYNQWVNDDAPDQLRTRLASSGAATQLNLGHLIQQTPTSAQRGDYRGSGFELRTDAWAMLRGGDGLLISTTARPQQGPGIASTQLDTTEATSRLRGASELAKVLAGAATQQNALSSSDALQAQHTFIARIDPRQRGKHAERVGGLRTFKPKPGTREHDTAQPVEKFAAPLVLLEAPGSINWATPASTIVFAGQQLSWTMQSDLHVAAGDTASLVTGNAAAFFTHDGDIRIVAGNGPLSLQAHTDKLEILADQAITIVAVDGAIRILAKHKVTLQAGRCALTLDEGNITFACPGNFTVKGGQHLFKAGGRGQLEMPVLPNGITELKNFIAINYRDAAGDPMAGVAYKIKFLGGAIVRGKLDEMGNARHENVPEKPVLTEYEARIPSPESPWDALSTMVNKAREKLT